ncbi:hypothetical protein DDZ18_00305 [Marinicauda salina]|uniref:DUF4243 domain-containing protein n=1 Tax=Marinicauda salina TaxID=2135793 RepID=A0A2U2BVR5_9PROT|nr:questin oxidase family protein [Marinicauda salina]PWE18092.1 hypothetical protein DDZ18_00305 [Marinicauda salina]
MTDPYALHDRALEILRPYGPSLANGLFNHAPMVVEALAAMGRGGDALAWIEAERAGFQPRPSAQDPIDPAHWRETLGARERFEDWAVFFRAEIAERSWRAALDLWAQRLAPGYGAAAVHGVLRTAHAARALAAEATAPRLDELADALAAWAASYAELPVEAGAECGDLDPEPALGAVTPIAAELRPTGGSITGGLARLARARDFAAETARADLSGDADAIADALVLAFARLFLDAARDAYGAVVFTHAVTGAAAARNLLPLTGEATGRALLSGAWRTGCALKAVFLPADGEAAADLAVPAPDALAEAAVRHGDDHAIKLAEACLSSHARRPEPDLLRAGALALRLLPARETATAAAS